MSPAQRTSGGPRAEVLSDRVKRYGEVIGRLNFDELADEYKDIQAKYEDAQGRLAIAEALLNRALLIVGGAGPVNRV